MVLACLLCPARYVAARVLCKVALAIALMVGPVWAAPLKLVAFGDSLTHGFGHRQGEGFVPQLQRWLDGQGREVAVINMGVSGDTTEGGRARLGWTLADGADALILALGGNDLLRGIDPARSRENLDAMLTELAARNIPVLLVGLDAPLNYGAEWKAAFEGMYAELATKHGVLFHPSFMAGIVERRDLMQDDGVHPNAAGVALQVERIGPKVLELLDRAGG